MKIPGFSAQRRTTRETAQAQRSAAGPTISPAELNEFRLRHQEVAGARGDFLRAHAKLVMLDEAYRSWLRTLGAKYGVGSYFDINTDTGALTPRVRDEAPAPLPVPVLPLTPEAS